MNTTDRCNREQVGRYLLNRMTAEEETRFQQHLAGCKSCRQYMGQIRSLASLLKEEELGGLSLCRNERTNNIKRYWISIAASLLLLVGLSVFWFVRRTSGEVYPTSVMYKNRATYEQTDNQVVSPNQKTVQVKGYQDVCFRWDTEATFHLKIKDGVTVLFEIAGKGSEYVLPVKNYSAYPSLHWDLTVGEQSYSGELIFQKTDTV